MTTTMIPAETRELLLRECGAATETTTLALNLWEAGDRFKALRTMWDDGADEEWLTRFTAAVGCDSFEASALIRDLQAWSEW